MIAIHNDDVGFHSRWVEYCTQNNIPFKRVNCYSSDIVSQLSDCKALLWHHNHAYAKDQLVAKQILFALEHSGFKVFPNFKTAWHFDDKVAQKYLLEAHSIQHVPSYVFLDKKNAMEWVEKIEYPVVFKLRRGAGSKNVKLIENLSQAKKYINIAFGRGFRQIDAWGDLNDTLRKYRLGKSSLKSVLKSFAHLYYPFNIEKALGREKSYVYFQKFIPQNTFDIRVIVIKDKAFAIKRNVRKNDFRASGSGHIEYEKNIFDESWIKLSFENADKLKSDCIAFDYVFENEKPLIVEISYGFAAIGYDPCPGYWDRDLKWNEGKFNPYGWMVELVK